MVIYFVRIPRDGIFYSFANVLHLHKHGASYICGYIQVLTDLNTWRIKIASDHKLTWKITSSSAIREFKNNEALFPIRWTAARSSKINTNQTHGAIHRCSNKRCSSSAAFHDDDGDVLLTPTRVYNIRSRFTLSLILTLYVYNTVTSIGYGPLLRQSACLLYTPVSPPVSLRLSKFIYTYDIIFTRVVEWYLVTCHPALLHHLHHPSTLAKRSLSLENEQGN